MSFFKRRENFLNRKAAILARMQEPSKLDLPKINIKSPELDFSSLTRTKPGRQYSQEEIDAAIASKTSSIMGNLVESAEEHMNYMSGLKGSVYDKHQAEMGKACAPQIGIYNAHCRLSIAYMEQKAFANDAENPLKEIHEDVKGEYRHANVSNSKYYAEMKDKYPQYVKEVMLVKDVDAAVADFKKKNPKSKFSDEAIRANYMSVDDLKPGDEIHVESTRSQSGKHAIMYKGKDENGNYMAISHNPEKLWNVFKGGNEVPVVVYQKNNLVNDKMRDNFAELQRAGGTDIAMEYLNRRPRKDTLSTQQVMHISRMRAAANF